VPNLHGGSSSSFAGAAEEFKAELDWLDLLLHAEITRRRARGLLGDKQAHGLHFTDSQLDTLILPTASPQTGPTIKALLEEADSLRRANAARRNPELPLAKLTRIFGLDPFETGALVLAMAGEIDLRYEALFSCAQNDAARRRPTVDLALKLLCPEAEERWSARQKFHPDAALLRNQLLRLPAESQDADPPFVSRVLSADQRIVDFVLGASQIDGRLSDFCRIVRGVAATGPALVMADTVRRRPNGLVFLLHGPPGTGKKTNAASAAASLGMNLLVADVRIAPPVDAIPWALLRREARLSNACLYLDHWDVIASGPSAPILERELTIEGRPFFLGGEEPSYSSGTWPRSCVLAYEFRRPSLGERGSEWKRALNGAPDIKRLDFRALAARFTLSPGQMRQALDQARLLAGERGLRTEDLQTAARTVVGGGLHRLARRLDTRQTWDDLVVPPKQAQQLREIVRTLRHRDQVFGSWGFDGKLRSGRGIGVLFAGQSGTGKTMAAAILARELELDLYQIDLASVVSKYIGETEKNLSRIFQSAETSNAILLFDEADAIFGKRSEVRDAHDRYANIEVAYLLQRMEAYEGIIILSTNLKSNLDDGFARRLQHSIEFPFPDAGHRERIWRKAFPQDAPMDAAVDFGFMAQQFELSGGNIRNIALAAAFLAAEEKSAIRMEHVILSTERELNKIGRLPTKAAFGNYWEALRQRG
jgi:ATP-dependent 26S proteasome regulatory subunit